MIRKTFLGTGMFFRQNAFAVALILLCALIAFLNYKPGTFLSGWDTLHPEFNLLEYIKRGIFGAYQVHQGLGAVSSQSHAAELSRMILYIPLYLLFPLSFVRYSYIFLMMILGTLGMYFFLKKAIFLDVPSLRREIVSCLGAVFYLLNLGTVQHFYTPLEMFPTLFAALPWLFYSAIQFLEHGGKKKLLFFSLVTFFSAPAAHTATLWYAYFFSFLVYLVFVFILKRKTLNKVLMLILVTVVLNLYWILPNLYFVAQHGKEVQLSKIHSLFTDEAFAKNVEFSGIGNIALIKSFPFDWGIYKYGKEFVPLMDPWIRHQKNFFVMLIGYGYFAVAILGVFYAVHKRNTYLAAFLGVAFVSLFFLRTTTFPSGFIFSALQNKIPLFQESLRFPFTKFSLPFIFSFALFFAYGCKHIIEKFSRFRFLGSQIVVSGAICASIFFYMFPAFTGNFISPEMKVKIPKEYFNLFEWFRNQPQHGRVATLPVQSFWGWNYYSWGYQGAGFTWFGVSNPILEREFDRWSPYNEQYFREMSYAVYTQNDVLFKQVVKKYDVSYILLDKNIITPGVNSVTLFYKQLSDLLNRLKTEGFVSPPVVFGNMLVYSVSTHPQYPISSLSTVSLVAPKNTVFYEDDTYSTYKDYIVDPHNLIHGSTLFYPLKNIIDNQSKLDASKLTLNEDSIVFSLPKEEKAYQFAGFSSLPSYIPSDVVVKKENEKLVMLLYPANPVFDNQPSAVPLQAEFYPPPLPGNNLVLSINNQLLTVPNLTENTPLALDKVYLNSASNHIALYSFNPGYNYLPLLEYTNPLYSYCNAGDQEVLKGFRAKESLQITKDPNASVCVFVPLEFVKKFFGESGSQEKMLSISFQYLSKSKLSACIRTNGESSCNNHLKINNRESLKSVSLALGEKEFSSQLVIHLDPTEAAPNEVLSQMRFSQNSPTASVDIGSEFISKSFLNQSINPFKRVTLSRNIFSSTRKVTQEKRFNNDCKLKPNTQVSKEIIKVAGSDVIGYKSDQENFCDHFSYEQLPHSLAYLVLVESKNESGLPLNFCISNYTTERCDVYAKLTKFKDFDTDIFYLPASGANQGYDVNIENIGIKRSPSVNFLKSINFVPIYDGVFERIYAIKKGSQYEDFKNGRIETQKQYNPFLFQLTTNGKPTLINLSYSFEPGFEAYTISCSYSVSCFIKTVGAPIFGRQIREHVLVNNWSNGWVAPENKYSNQKIVALFLPQYLEYFGFACILICFAVLLSPLYRTRIVSQPKVQKTVAANTREVYLYKS